MRFLWRPGNKIYMYYAAYNRRERERERGKEKEGERERGREGGGDEGTRKKGRAYTASSY